jgi:hypothetical protein
MRIVKNDRLIARNGRIARWTSLGALAVLGAAVYLQFQGPKFLAYSVGMLVLGFAMTQVGMYFSNRWGRSPRPDEQLDAGLKGLPGETVIYHYLTPAPHLLVGPMGLWIFLPFHQRGTVTFERDRWRLRGGGFMQGYMTIFGQEGLGRPDLEAAAQIDAVRRHLVKHMDTSAIPPINAALVFTGDNVRVESVDTPIPALPIRKLKDFMRQAARGNAAPTEAMLRVQACLPAA